MLPRTSSIWQHDSQPNASGKPGAVQIVRSVEQLLRQASPAEQYSALLATALLTDPTYHWIKDQLRTLGEWDTLAHLETAAATVALPPP